MELLIFALGLILIYLIGTLFMAVGLSMRYGDPSACYKLFAVRDQLVDAVVFHGVDRNDPWLQAVYENVNSILVHSNLLSGPDRWPIAHHVGAYLGAHPEKGKRLRPVPGYEPPRQLQPVLTELRSALDYLIKNHFGVMLFFSAQQREQRRIQKEKAKALREMMKRPPLALC